MLCAASCTAHLWLRLSSQQVAAAALHKRHESAVLEAAYKNCPTSPCVTLVACILLEAWGSAPCCSAATHSASAC